jgi:hypothetical protein
VSIGISTMQRCPWKRPLQKKILIGRYLGNF